MSHRVHRSVECPRCHIRYVIGTNPYSNGSYIVSEATTEIDLRRLFCACSVPDYYEFKLSQLEAYAVSRSIYERGYGSVNEIVALSEGRRRQVEGMSTPFSPQAVPKPSGGFVRDGPEYVESARRRELSNAQYSREYRGDPARVSS